MVAPNARLGKPDQSQISDLKFEIRDTNPSIFARFFLAFFAFPNKIVDAKNAKAPQSSQRKKPLDSRACPLAVRSGFVGQRSPRVAKNATGPDR